MIKDITLGQYYETESVLHSLDPRVKLTGTLFYIISLFIFDNLFGFVLATLFLTVAIILSHVPFKFMIKGMKAIIFLLMITVIFNLLFTSGEPLFSIWKITITKQGLTIAVVTMFRLTYLILGSSLMTLTTTPNQLTDGLEKSLKPMKVVGFPVHEVAMMMSIALRFIPILMDETDKIMKAQMARGADFESGNLIKKAKAMVPLLVPLFVSAFRRANDLAMAMEARGYRGGEGRTKYNPLIYKKIDYIAYVILYIYLIAMVVLNFVF